jgi:hypothetical protein
MVGWYCQLHWWYARTSVSLRTVRIFNTLKEALHFGGHLVGFSHFLCNSVLYHVSPTTIGELKSHYLQSPIWVEGMHTTGCCLVP